jgi:hypothetical protein
VNPGYKTTEFYTVWATNIGLLVSAVAGNLPPKYAALGATIAAGAYAIARAIAKFGTPPPPPGDLPEV